MLFFFRNKKKGTCTSAKLKVLLKDHPEKCTSFTMQLPKVHPS